MPRYFSSPDLEILKTSFWAFAVAFLFPLSLQFALGQNFISEIWTIFGITFHEVGHFLFGAILQPVFRQFGYWNAYSPGPVSLFGGFFFTNIAGLLLLAFSLLLLSSISQKKLGAQNYFVAFSFLLFSYANLFVSLHGLMRAGHIFGCEKCDFARSAFILSVPEDTLLYWMWIVQFAAFAVAILLNLFFIFRKTAEIESANQTVQ